MEVNICNIKKDTELNYSNTSRNVCITENEHLKNSVTSGSNPPGTSNWGYDIFNTKPTKDIFIFQISFITSGFFIAIHILNDYTIHYVQFKMVAKSCHQIIFAINI